ncbi:HK97 gp10 family phage protein [Rhodococcus sp. UNC363MFTsu5.1]|uniref:HK97 gp10 family phage protein n=1 Tax=Rhodococcus sp. UNC363MFTsu5.1 TaxID=1449069 RepID=UPI000481B063|nr:HK97 gp10 family phage protein [Rhodococcus sp. UNC363MFTsu5.1]
MAFDASRALQAIRAAAEQGLADAAEVVKQEAIERAPVETGVLRNSAGTAQEDLEAAVYFDTEYAVVVHENLGSHHPEGEAKYLENAVVATKWTVAAVIAESIRRQLG